MLGFSFKDKLILKTIRTKNGGERNRKTQTLKNTIICNNNIIKTHSLAIYEIEWKILMSKM
jgi:hypothetical protein